MHRTHNRSPKTGAFRWYCNTRCTIILIFTRYVFSRKRRKIISIHDVQYNIGSPFRTIGHPPLPPPTCLQIYIILFTCCCDASRHLRRARGTFTLFAATSIYSHARSPPACATSVFRFYFRRYILYTLYKRNHVYKNCGVYLPPSVATRVIHLYK
jgi:hypothetical protein